MNLNEVQNWEVLVWQKCYELPGFESDLRQYIATIYYILYWLTYPFQARASALRDQNTGQVRKVILTAKSKI
jgi:hypothetical protein